MTLSSDLKTASIVTLCHRKARQKTVLSISIRPKTLACWLHNISMQKCKLYVEKIQKWAIEKFLIFKVH